VYLTNKPLIVHFTKTQVNNFYDFSEAGSSLANILIGVHLANSRFGHLTYRTILLVHTRDHSAGEVWPSRGDEKSHNNVSK